MNSRPSKRRRRPGSSDRSTIRRPNLAAARPTRSLTPDPARLDRIVAEARRARDEREQGYRERALKIYPWVCGRCARTFDHTTVRQLTVHHRDHNHENNPPDGSNWELLCLYCHDNEHQRRLEAASGGSAPSGSGSIATHSPFANLKDMLEGKNRK